MDKAVPSLGATAIHPCILAYQPAPAARRSHSERRRPEDTVLYQVVQEHLETFLAQVEAETRIGLARNLFKRSSMPSCNAGSSPTAFSACGVATVPMRSLWPSAASGVASVRAVAPGAWPRPLPHLVDHVIPRVPVRQWVLSFPIQLRVLFAAHPALLTPVLRIVHRVIATFLIKQSGLKRADAATGAVTLIQRFGSAADLNIHSHCLV